MKAQNRYVWIASTVVCSPLFVASALLAAPAAKPPVNAAASAAGLSASADALVAKAKHFEALGKQLEQKSKFTDAANAYTSAGNCYSSASSDYTHAGIAYYKIATAFNIANQTPQAHAAMAKGQALFAKANAAMKASGQASGEAQQATGKAIDAYGASKPKPPARKTAMRPPTVHSGAAANTISGRVTFADGRPASGAVLHITGVSQAGSSRGKGGRRPDTVLTAKSGIDGWYRLRVPSGKYAVTGYVAIPYQGQTFTIRLTPQSGGQESSPGGYASARDGLLRNFTVDIAAPLIVSDASTAPYGQAVWANGGTLQITLTPTGPLLDGSAGSPVVRTETFDSDEARLPDWRVPEVPIGAYTASATLFTPGGVAKPLRVRLVGGAVQDNVAVKFIPIPRNGAPSPVTLYVTQEINARTDRSGR